MEYWRDELYHYGIKGQKWGIRRFQNPDGTLTPEGRKRAKAEYKADNKEAFRLGRAATITSRALDKSNKRLSKHPTDIEKKTNERIKEAHEYNVDAMKKHYDALISKYGKEAIADIAYDKKGRLSESTTSIGEVAVTSVLSIAGTVGAAALGSPVGVVFTPKTKNQLGREYYKQTRKKVRKERDGG